MHITLSSIKPQFEWPTTQHHISTKTIIGFLNSEINLNEIFWKINILPYHIQNEGVIKKQIKINSSSKEEVVWKDLIATT